MAATLALARPRRRRRVRAGGFGGGRLGRYVAASRPNAQYDGRFTFVRLRYGPETPYAGQQIPWSHDYPLGEQHFMQIVNEMTLSERARQGNEHPAARRARSCSSTRSRTWPSRASGRCPRRRRRTSAPICRRAGFVIFDDFAERRGFPERGGGWGSFEYSFRRVLPNAQFVDLDVIASDLPCVLRDRDVRYRPAGVRRRPAGLPRRLRGQRPEQAADRDDQLQHRHLRVLGVLGHRPQADRRIERGVQARRQLHHLRDDTLSRSECRTTS